MKKLSVLFLFFVLSCGNDSSDDDFVDSQPTCGDGRCEVGESCSADCQPTGPVCGDGRCQAGEVCAADCDVAPACGDGLCEPAESCAADCGAAGCTLGECPGEQFCRDGVSCVDAFPRRYQLTFLWGRINERKPDGSSWDFGGGAPDPVGILYVDSEEIGRTSTIDDRYNWELNETAEVNLIAGSRVGFALYDADVSEYDYITGCEATMSIEAVRAGLGQDIECGNSATGGGFFMIRIHPL